MVAQETKTLKLLALLRARGRATLTQLAKKLGMPISTTFDRLRACEGRQIERFTALLDFAELGFSARAFLLLRVSKTHKESLAKALMTHPNINTLMRINNGWDFLAECVFPDIRRLEGFLDELETQYTIRTVQVHYVIDDLRREGFLADEDLVENLFAHEKKRRKV